MKIVILNRSNLSVANKYGADAPNQGQYGGPWGDPSVTIHVAIPSEIDDRAAEFAWVGDEVVVSESAVIKAVAIEKETVIVIETAVAAAIHFGQRMMIKFAAENVRLGITQDGQTGAVLNKMSSVMVALQSGSLYEAVTRAKAIPQDVYDVKYVTHNRVYAFINEIETYLGLPLSI